MGCFTGVERNNISVSVHESKAPCTVAGLTSLITLGGARHGSAAAHRGQVSTPSAWTASAHMYTQLYMVGFAPGVIEHPLRGKLE